MAGLWNHRSAKYCLVGTDFEVFQTRRGKYEPKLDYTIRILEMCATREKRDAPGSHQRYARVLDVRGCIIELIEAGYASYAGSNGDPPVLDSSLITQTACTPSRCRVRQSA